MIKRIIKLKNSVYISITVLNWDILVPLIIVFNNNSDVERKINILLCNIFCKLICHFNLKIANFKLILINFDPLQVKFHLICYVIWQHVVKIF